MFLVIIVSILIEVKIVLPLARGNPSVWLLCPIDMPQVVRDSFLNVPGSFKFLPVADLECIFSKEMGLLFVGNDI